MSIVNWSQSKPNTVHRTPYWRASGSLIGVTGGSYDLTGVVAPNSVSHDGSQLDFEIADRDDAAKKIPVTYQGTVPDPFREGREVIVTGTMTDGTFIADKDSLITKCPSKFADQAAEDPEHIQIQ